MEDIVVDLRDWPYAVLNLLGDLHFENIATDEDATENAKSKILSEAFSRVIGMGDYVDCIVSGDPRFDLSTRANKYPKPTDMENKVEEYWAPLASITDCALFGNHELTVMKKYGNFLWHVCKRLKMRYGGWSAIITYKMKHGDFRIYVTHSKGSHSSKVRDPIRRDAALRDYIRAKTVDKAYNCQAYCIAHIHRLRGFREYKELKMITKDGKTSFIEEITEPFLGVTGQFMRGYDSVGIIQKDGTIEPVTSYVEIGGYKPQPVGFLQIIIDDKGDILGHNEVVL